MGKIVAIGGGEVQAGETRAIDQEILKLTGKTHPKLLFIPTASSDSVDYYESVQKHFLSLGCAQVNPLYLSDKTLTKAQIEQTILSHDAIYVGGGNTLRLMTIWRKLGVDTMLKKAYNKGIVLSGLSAGSICWFSFGNSDSRKFTSGSNKLIKVTGLGLIDALHCPHYDSETHRQTDLKRMTKTSSKVAIALDNCAALEVVDNTYRIITSNPAAKARKVYWQNGEYRIEEIPTSDLFADINPLLKK